MKHLITYSTGDIPCDYRFYQFELSADYYNSLPVWFRKFLFHQGNDYYITGQVNHPVQIRLEKSAYSLFNELLWNQMCQS